MSTPSGIILDLDGTVCRGGRLLPGAGEAIAELRRRGHPLVFTTNALESPAWQAARLTRLGVPARPDEVVTAPWVLARYLRRHLPGAALFVIGDPPLLEELAAGFRLSDDPEEIDAVVVSCDQTFDFCKLNTGFQALRRGARFLAVNADATCPVPGGELPDAGAVIGALEGCSRRQLELVAGKPSALMLAAILERLGRPAGDCWIVGDSLQTDVLMGRRAGMTTTLVLTGVTRRADTFARSFQACPGRNTLSTGLAQAPASPDHVLESIAGVPDLL